MISNRQCHCVVLPYVKNPLCWDILPFKYLKLTLMFLVFEPPFVYFFIPSLPWESHKMFRQDAKNVAWWKSLEVVRSLNIKNTAGKPYKKIKNCGSRESSDSKKKKDLSIFAKQLTKAGPLYCRNRSLLIGIRWYVKCQRACFYRFCQNYRAVIRHVTCSVNNNS
jgi:hypothetical protein